MQYAFILGRNQKLSIEEILAVLPGAKIIDESGSFLIVENLEFDCEELLDRLGGTIKIGVIISGKKLEKAGKSWNEDIVDMLKNVKEKRKLNFGISFYESKESNIGMDVKTKLKEAGISCRLVTARDKALSSVVVKKNKCHEFMVLRNKYLARTRAVQEFEEYGFRDYGRPKRDMKSGTMPPKLAKIMINLAQAPKTGTILDPFCGSGTIIQEALLMGYEDVIGSDISEKAINDTKKNLEWLAGTYKLQATSYKLFNTDVRNISKTVGRIDAIVTEPYLGPTITERIQIPQIKEIVKKLSELYIEAFGEFRKILKSGGKIVIIIPAFRRGDQKSSAMFELPILEKIKQLGFIQVNREKLIYSREGQKVWRQIYVFS